MKKVLMVLIIMGALAFSASAQTSNMVKALKTWVAANDSTYFYQIWVIAHMETDVELVNYLNAMAQVGWEITMIPLPMSPDRKYPTTAHMMVTFRKR
jgi:hypothetical protein